MGVIQNVNVIMEIVMNNLKYDDLKNIWDGENNLTDKPIFIDLLDQYLDLDL